MGDRAFLPHIAMQIFNEPLMIQPSKLDVILRVLGPRVGLSDMETVDESELSMARQPSSSKVSTIAIIPVIGTFVHRRVNAPSGVQTYEQVQARFDAAVEDNRVDGIMLEVDSHGGASSGAFPLSDRIYNARDKKPIYAFVNENAYSAGYLMASGANKILVTKTSGLGSIGVVMLHADQSELDKKEGVKYTYIYEGKRKVDFNPHEPLSQEALNTAQESTRSLYEMFAANVSERRNMAITSVRETEAGIYMGEEAVSIGLADHIVGSMDEAIELMVSDMATNNNRLARGGAGTKKEVKSTMTTLAELKAESPDLYDSFMDLAKAEAEATLQAKKTAQETGLQEQISELEGKVKNLHDQNAQLEKDNYIRAENERKAKNETAAETIWVKALSACDVPEDMHGKVRKMVKVSDHLSEKVLNTESFQTAVDAEIADWEGKGMKTSVLGSGYQTKTGEGTDPDAVSAKKEEEADDAAVLEMLDVSGDVEAANKMRSEMEAKKGGN